VSLPGNAEVTRRISRGPLGYSLSDIFGLAWLHLLVIFFCRRLQSSDTRLPPWRSFFTEKTMSEADAARNPEHV
jgi:hypothetical protein